MQSTDGDAHPTRSSPWRRSLKRIRGLSNAPIESWGPVVERAQAGVSKDIWIDYTFLKQKTAKK